MGNDAETKRSGNLQLPVKRSIWMVQEFYAMRAKKGVDHEKKISSSTSSGQVSCSSWCFDYVSNALPISQSEPFFKEGQLEDRGRTYNALFQTEAILKLHINISIIKQKWLNKKCLIVIYAKSLEPPLISLILGKMAHMCGQYLV